jgi:hypothetical protein
MRKDCFGHSPCNDVPFAEWGGGRDQNDDAIFSQNGLVNTHLILQQMRLSLVTLFEQKTI